MPLIFISHAAADKPLADAVFDLLQMGCNLSSDQIFCTSVDGADIEVGEDFVAWIEGSLKGCDLALLIITPNYKASRFCIAEMGAAWALGKKVFPMVLPDHPRDIGGVMLGRQTAVFDGPGLDNLRDAIATIHRPAAEATPRWNIKRADFLEQIGAIAKSLPQPDTVSLEELKAEREKVEGAKDIRHSLETENRSLREQVAKLEKAKDPVEVALIRKEMLPADDQYEKLVQNVRGHLDSLTGVEVRCVFATLKGEPWYPENWEYHRTEIEQALQSEWINDHDNCYNANERHPRLRTAFAALEELNAFIQDEESSQLLEQMEEDLKCLVDIQNMQFWKEVLYSEYFPR